jgi:uncharacterized membrane protein
MNKKLAFVWVFLILLLLWQVWSAYGQLPERMPSHFNLQGEPDAYASKSEFLKAWLLAMVVLNALVPLCRLILALVPRSMINVPNRSYWLTTPERRREVAFKMTNLMAFVFSVLDLMFLIIFESIRSYAMTGKAIVPLWTPMLLLPIVFVFPMVYVFRTFRVPSRSK